jgi:hypothetical protein
MGASLDKPFRGRAEDRPTGVPIPPEHLPLFKHWQLRKTWQYVSFWSPELSICVARLKVGLLTQEYWGVWDRAGQQFRTKTHFFSNCVTHELKRTKVADGDVEIDIQFEPANSFELYRPADRAYMWAHKDYCPGARATVRYGDSTRSAEGVLFVDIQAGYHERNTKWRWVAGVGRDQNNRLVGFNAIVGVFDTPVNSERTIWIENEATEIGPNSFSEDLNTIHFTEGGVLHFQPEQLIHHHDNFILIRSDYYHWFGSFSGTLPGGIELREAHGVRERHDVLW